MNIRSGATRWDTDEMKRYWKESYVQGNILTYLTLSWLTLITYVCLDGDVLSRSYRRELRVEVV
ncbi:hypothetical protein K402DRAFT_25259 [Aulographum hederae CBS 113979]|uniref:Uncharacterized protein n=1 Tax=Aulographum hederae CBS 113979 TaxID=1176131 RepID=A0A6G1H5K2_9PEZI|nr:hypothetical protein K402DRAFT_25259 [Aulographum hederae CBS 113979]